MAFLAPAKPGDPFSVKFNSIPGEYYAFEYTDDLFASIVDWTVLPSSVVASGTTTTITAPAPPAEDIPARFYRVIQVPPP